MNVDIELREKIEMVKVFTAPVMTEYLQGIGCRKTAGRFNKCWEVYACFVAFNHGWDSSSLLNHIQAYFAYRGFEQLRIVDYHDLSRLVGCPIDEVEADQDYFIRNFGSGDDCFID